MTTLYFDGASKKNPGKSGYGFIIKVNGATILEGHGHISHATNNEAEYMGLIQGLKELSEIDNSSEELTIRGDSSLVINHMNKSWKIKAHNLIPLNQQANKNLDALKSRYKKIVFEYIPRNINFEADLLANKGVIDLNYNVVRLI